MPFKRFCAAKTLMPGEFTSPVQIENRGPRGMRSIVWGGHFYLHHHALQRGYSGRSHRRAGEQRAVFLNAGLCTVRGAHHAHIYNNDSGICGRGGLRSPAECPDRRAGEQRAVFLNAGLCTVRGAHHAHIYNNDSGICGRGGLRSPAECPAAICTRHKKSGGIDLC